MGVGCNSSLSPRVGLRVLSNPTGDPYHSGWRPFSSTWVDAVHEDLENRASSLSGSPRIGGYGAVAARLFSSTKRVDRGSMNTDTKIHPPQSPRKRGEADYLPACGEGWGGVSGIFILLGERSS